MNKHLLTDYYTGGGTIMAYSTQGKHGARLGFNFVTETQKRLKRGYFYQFSYFLPKKVSFQVPVMPTDYFLNGAHPSDKAYESTAHHRNSYVHFSFGTKRYIVGHFSSEQGAYVMWDFGMGFSYNTFEIEGFDEQKHTSPYQKPFDADIIGLGSFSAGLGYSRKYKIFELYSELRTNIFPESMYVLSKDLLKDNPEYLDIHLKSIPNFYSFNFGIRKRI